MGTRAVQIPRLLGLFLPLALSVAACTPDPSAPSEGRELDISAGKAATTADMSVSSAAPDSATQDTTLDVVINGSGFVAGTEANWALTGVQDPTQVRTNSTRYVNSRQLVANITIAANATVAKWDIVVTAAGKKGGIGTESFTVTPHKIPTTWKVPLSTAGLGLVSDGAQGDGSYSLYDDGVCSVSSGVLVSGDITMQTNNPRTKTRTCSGRTMTLVYPVGDPVYPSGGRETMLVFMNLHNISSDTTAILTGYDNRVLRHLALNPTQKQRCDAWRWQTATGFAGDKVWVERMNATTYHVYTQDRDPDPVLAAANASNNRAICTTTGQAHHLSVDFYVVSKELLP